MGEANIKFIFFPFTVRSRLEYPSNFLIHLILKESPFKNKSKISSGSNLNEISISLACI